VTLSILPPSRPVSVPFKDLEPGTPFRLDGSRAYLYIKTLYEQAARLETGGLAKVVIDVPDLQLVVPCEILSVEAREL